MELIKVIQTNNDCYRAGRKIKVKGLMLHSVGCNQPNASVFVKRWDRSGVAACVHAFIDGKTGAVYQTLPWNHRGWHGGGASNNTHIGVEMCEPAEIKYVGGSKFECSDFSAARKVARTTYRSAVELFAFLCKQYKLDPLTDICSHREGYLKGIATNHGDPEHLWRQLNLEYTMDGFRADVKKMVDGETSAVPSTPVGQGKPIEVGRLVVDGSHGPATIRAKQRLFKCSIVDGIISSQPISNKKYCYALVQGRCTDFVSDEKAYGSNLVRKEQEFLKQKGLYIGTIDGFFGKLTVKAKQEFLKLEGFYDGTIDGSYGNQTCKAEQRWINKILK